MRDLAVGSIAFEGVSKRYRLGGQRTLRDAVSALARRGNEDHGPQYLWALKDVSFGVEQGESLGIIGPNGSGKTTLLKLLSHITRPTSGRIGCSGRISSLIELGAGFHPELSGRDNIFLNGAILGLKRQEILRRFDDIVAFSELERFIDTPVKRYSSGMYVRLAFAVAAHVQPDILLVDEVLAVGDASFRRKCMERMRRLREAGVTVILVSHNPTQIRRLCRRTALLVEGQLRYLGETEGALAAYERLIIGGAEDVRSSSRNLVRVSSDTLLLRRIDITNEQGDPVDDLSHDQTIHVIIKYHAVQPVEDPVVHLWLVRSDSTVCALISSTNQSETSLSMDGEGALCVTFDPLQLTAGEYFVEARIIDSTDSILLASVSSGSFAVRGTGDVHQPDQGVYVPRTTWSRVQQTPHGRSASR